MHLKILLIFAISFKILVAQDTISMQQLDPVFIEATRINVDLMKSAFSVDRLETNALNSPYQNFAINEYLNQVSGIFSVNQNNSAQDLRVSIRGFGARSAFGIRGVKLIVDGIPYTTPDGQGQLDNVWVGGIKNAEILKGAASGLYGNASGGIINMNTFDEKAKDFTRIGISFGAFNNHIYSLEEKATFGKSVFQGQLAYSNSDGFRAQSKSQNLNLNTSLSTIFSKKQQLEILFSMLSSPLGEDPGGVNLESVALKRDAARAQNINYHAGETLNQLNTALKYTFKINNHWKFRSNAFYSNRILDALLPFENGGAIDLSRNYAGIISNLNYIKQTKYWKHEFVVGIDYLYQNDLRLRFSNLLGVKGEELTNQNELFINKAGYMSFQSEYNKVLLYGGLRYDDNSIKLNDNFLRDGSDDSGTIFLHNLSPSFGISYNLVKYHFIYGMFSYGFETPALSELTNRPDNLAGLNLELLPQNSYNYEAGYKTRLGESLKAQIAVFVINTSDEILPYEISTFPGRTFFRNSGTSQRKGLESSLEWSINKYFEFYTSYTLSNFKFVEYDLNDEDLGGNFLPGIPNNNLYSSLKFNKNDFIFQFDSRYISKIYLNDSNSNSDTSYFVGNLKASKTIVWGATKWVPYFGINNLWNTDYNDNIRINAFGGNYFEPAPGINIYFGVKLEF